jgi:Ca2+-binding EF-hand superfamily protein
MTMTMNRPFCSILAAAALFATAAPALAGGAEDESSQTRIAKRVDTAFAKLDADKDGRISRAEAASRPRMAKHFDKIDADGDGYISRAELTAAIARHS